VEVAAVRVGAKCLQGVSGGVGVRREHLLGRRQQRTVGRQPRWRRGSETTSALTTLTAVIVVRSAVTMADVRVLPVSFLFTRGR